MKKLVVDIALYSEWQVSQDPESPQNTVLVNPVLNMGLSVPTQAADLLRQALEVLSERVFKAACREALASVNMVLKKEGVGIELVSPGANPQDAPTIRLPADGEIFREQKGGD